MDYFSNFISTRYGITDPEELWASGRAEDSRSFAQKIYKVNFLCKR